MRERGPRYLRPRKRLKKGARARVRKSAKRELRGARVKKKKETNERKIYAFARGRALERKGRAAEREMEKRGKRARKVGRFGEFTARTSPPPSLQRIY